MESLTKRYHLLNICEIEKHGDYYRILAEKKSRLVSCIHCNSEKILPHAISSVSLHDSPYQNARVFLVIKIKRYKCSTCKKTFLDKAPYRFKKNKMTENFAKYAKDEYYRNNLNKAAKKLKVGRPTILNALTVD